MANDGKTPLREERIKELLRDGVYLASKGEIESALREILEQRQTKSLSANTYTTVTTTN